MAGSINTPTPPAGVGQPLWLLAELTYRCPLHCVFCYNPVDFARHEDELSTADWLRVLREGQPATMEYNQERLNVITNDAGKITALRCG
mgnify:CR=1 FL=1